MSPEIAMYKVLQPAKDLHEQTWAAAIAAVQQEFAAVTAELSRSAREKQALTELIQRVQAGGEFPTHYADGAGPMYVGVFYNLFWRGC
jgi:hypothetical protein